MARWLVEPSGKLYDSFQRAWEDALEELKRARWVRVYRIPSLHERIILNLPSPLRRVVLRLVLRLALRLGLLNS